jgi:hypothetical protein
MMIQIYVYLVNGNVDIYSVENEWKAREHAEKIMNGGYRMRVGKRMEWFGKHYIDKVCWDAPQEDYLSVKYESPNQRKDRESK